MTDRDPDEARRKGAAVGGRFSRFARLSGLTAQVAARQIGQRMISSFQSEEAAERSRKATLEKSASQIASTMGQLKGAAMKVGQMLSADPELLPDEVQDALSTLQSKAPPMDTAMARAAVEDGLGGRIEDLFGSFDDEPLGAASIGQVHRATTREGDAVCVKVQYPGIRETIRSDLSNLRTLLGLMATRLPKERLDEYTAELTTVIERESDYLHEAEALERFFVVLKDVEGVRVPIPVHELTSATVLTMELVEGVPLFTHLETAPPDERHLLAERILRSYIEMTYVHQTLHADPHPGNFLVDPQGNLVFLDLGCIRDFEPAFTDGLLDTLLALWRGDERRLADALDGLGFDLGDCDIDLIFEWMELVLGPLLDDRAVHFGEWQVHDRTLAFIRDHPEILGFAAPKEALFYLRVLAGLRGLVGKTDVEVNVYRLAREAIARLRP